jgi:catechol 2,3-dioxygenase-like lactoylglutathione lyase family enzyme
MDGRTQTRWWGVALDAKDPPTLVRFYAEVLGWEVANVDEKGGALGMPGAPAFVSVQYSESYVPPTWPPAPGHQQMMLHLDVAVDDLDAAVAHALRLGARLSEFQPQDDVRVLLDPEGHPFCLYHDSSPEDPPPV